MNEKMIIHTGLNMSDKISVIQKKLDILKERYGDCILSVREVRKEQKDILITLKRDKTHLEISNDTQRWIESYYNHIERKILFYNNIILEKELRLENYEEKIRALVIKYPKMVIKKNKMKNRIEFYKSVLFEIKVRHIQRNFSSEQEEFNYLQKLYYKEAR